MDLTTAISTSHDAAADLLVEALARHGVAAHLREGLTRYFVHGIRPGSFLSAVLENNLGEAVQRASSPEALVPILRFLAMEVPAVSWGSKEAVAAWISARAARRREETHEHERQSAQPCGCDAGAQWTCERHREEVRQ